MFDEYAAKWIVPLGENIRTKAELLKYIDRLIKRVGAFLPDHLLENRLE
jgi:hypothetical protein